MATAREEKLRFSTSGAGRSFGSRPRRVHVPLPHRVVVPGISQQPPPPFQAWAEQRSGHARLGQVSPGVQPTPSHVGAAPTDSVLSQALLLPPLPRSSGRHSAPCARGSHLLLCGEGPRPRRPPLPRTPCSPVQEPRGDRVLDVAENISDAPSPDRTGQLDPETERRILEWLAQVNRSLFAPLSCGFKQEAETDISIKFVYQGH